MCIRDRLRGDYLAIVTLAFGEIIKNLVNVIYLGRDAEGFHLSFKATPKLGEGGEMLIKGAQGITGTPRPVSYTHLDVYKRQAYFRLAICMESFTKLI